jgi:hypothetical protein
MEMIQLIINKKGSRKRLFFMPPENNSLELSQILSDRVEDDLNFTDTLSEVIRIADESGFVVIPH